MTENFFEKLTRGLLICAALVFAACIGWEVKDAAFEQIAQYEMEDYRRWRNQCEEEYLLNHTTELKLDDREASASCEADRLADLL